MNYAALAARAQSQSPSLRGSGRFMHLIIRLLLDALEVSIPFIAGQWSLPLLQRLRHVLEQGLNPLHCGAVVASHRVDRVGGDHRASQSPSLRGSGRFSEAEERAKAEAKSQSPSLRGSGRFVAGTAAVERRRARLNPLHCGAVVASLLKRLRHVISEERLNPLHCGAVVASWHTKGSANGSTRFNPLHCGAVVASIHSRYSS